jgi:hypothetical protein
MTNQRINERYGTVNALADVGRCDWVGVNITTQGGTG